MTNRSSSPTGEDARLRHMRPALELRSRILHEIRSFFISRSFIEVETPVRVAAPALETHIDAEPSGDHFLRTSPELHMKRLVAAGYDRIFQMGPCFRRNERGRLHHPEYTMLEWYRTHADYMDILDDCTALVRHLAETTLPSPAIGIPGHTVRLDEPWRIHEVGTLFEELAGWNPVGAFDADRFDLDLVNVIEPALRACRAPVILKDYPREAAALARLDPGHPGTAQRWELYVAGIEIANAYSELTDAAEQRARFERVAGTRAAMGKDVYALDHDFLNALEKGLPPCGGIALGVDRLVMLFAGAETLDAVLPFRE